METLSAEKFGAVLTAVDQAIVHLETNPGYLLTPVQVERLQAVLSKYPQSNPGVTITVTDSNGNQQVTQEWVQNQIQRAFAEFTDSIGN